MFPSRKYLLTMYSQRKSTTAHFHNLRKLMAYPYNWRTNSTNNLNWHCR